jgi:Protein of unknown function (DUF2793)/Chaperone of endosialidase
MSSQTNRLNLSYILASQADKHVALNESLALLDGLVMGAVKSRTLSTPPASSLQDDRYLVGASPTGAWTGRGGQFAMFQDGAWLFRAPLAGWVLWAEAELAMLAFDGATWRVLGGQLLGPTQIDSVGIGTSPDPLNPFHARLNAALFTARPTQDGGDGHVRLSLNRQDATKSATLAFQTNFQSDAEVSLVGGGGFSVRVKSSTGTWNNAINFNVADGRVTMLPNGLSVGTIKIGHGATSSTSCLAIGAAALVSLTSGTDNLALGSQALEVCTSGNRNIGLGRLTLSQTTTGSQNVCVGVAAMLANVSGSYCCSVGNQSLQSNTNGTENSAFGYAAMSANTTGSLNCAFGLFALYSNTTGSLNTAIGRYAMSNATGLSNCSVIGHNAQVTGSNQVQLGDSATTTYVFGTVQNRSDSRDKADIRDTIHGLDFIRALRPVDFRWNYREDYCPAAGAHVIGNAGGTIMDSHKNAPSQQAVDIQPGSKKRKRFHSGLIAQEVAAVLAAQSTDFGGLQDHGRDGRFDVMTLGYDEFIAPLIKAVQQLADRMDQLE